MKLPGCHPSWAFCRKWLLLCVQGWVTRDQRSNSLAGTLEPPAGAICARCGSSGCLKSPEWSSRLAWWQSVQPPWGFEGTEGVVCLPWLGLDSLQTGECLPHPWAPSRGCYNPGMELLPNSHYATRPLIAWRTSCSQLLLASPLFWCKEVVLKGACSGRGEDSNALSPPATTEGPLFSSREAPEGAPLALGCSDPSQKRVTYWAPAAALGSRWPIW